MVQAMMRNDPRFSSNPMLRQVMDELTSNPLAAQQVASMMSDPTMRTMMDQAMRQGASGSGGGAGLGGLPWGAGIGGVPPSRPAGGAPAQPRQPQQQQGGASDEDLTEEEMIAEAIRRSLQDGA
jgi:hypothetical protein